MSIKLANAPDYLITDLLNKPTDEESDIYRDITNQIGDICASEGLFRFQILLVRS